MTVAEDAQDSLFDSFSAPTRDGVIVGISLTENLYVKFAVTT